MPYTNSITFLDIEGGSSLTSELTARLWMLKSVYGEGTGSGDIQQEEEAEDVTVRKDGSAAASFSFNKDADYSYASRSVGISIQDKIQVSQDKGWLFRSGAFLNALTTETIDIITGNKEITDAELQTMLPAVPITVDAQTSITAITAMLADGGIDFTATGTTSKTGVVVSFRYTGMLLLSPSNDVSNAASEAISVGVSNPAIVFFQGPSILSAVEAEILNTLRVVVIHEFFPKIRIKIEAKLNTAIIEGMGRVLANGALPAGIVLSVRTLTITTAKITVRGALGAFGGVMNKIPVDSSKPGKITCFIATAAYGVDSTEVQILRDFRDAYLLTNSIGRKFVALYEFLSPGIANYISGKPHLKRLIRSVILYPFVRMARLFLDWND